MASDGRNGFAQRWHRLAIAAWLSVGLGAAFALNETPPPQAFDVGLDEKIGQTLPGDAVFYDEHGARHTLAELIDRPTILALVFYHCPVACGLIQGNLAHALQGVKEKLGADYQVLTISFDDEEVPELALETKANFMRIIGPGYPDNAWRFMTGDLENIKKTTGAVGFRFMKYGKHDFMHPNLVTVLAPGGKIIRYLYGTDYLPMEVSMALSEASRGTPGVSIKKIMSYCFAYDSKSRRYAFRFFRVFGTTMLVLVGGFLFFLLRKGKEEGGGEKA